MDESILIPIDIDTSKALANVTSAGSAIQKKIFEFAPGGKINIPFTFNTAAVSAAVADVKKQIASIPAPKDPFKPLIPGANQLTNATKGTTQALINTGRVLQDLPFGFIGIANNLNPLLESFQRLKAETGSGKDALKAMASSLTGAGGVGLALSVVTAALTFATMGLGAWTRGLFGASEKTNSFEKDLLELSRVGDKAKESMESLARQAEFLSQLGDLTIGINFGNTDQQDVLKAQTAFVGANEKIGDLAASVTKLGEASKKSFRLFLDGASQSTVETALAFSTLRDIPDEIVQNFSKNDKKLFDVAKKNEVDLLDFQKQLEAARNDVSLKGAQIRLINTEIQRKKDKEAADESRKAIDDTISRAKELASFLDAHTIRSFSFEVDPRDSKGTTFQKAKEFLSRVENDFQSFKLKPFIAVEPEFKKLDFSGGAAFDNFSAPAKQISDALKKEVERMMKNNPLSVEVQLHKESMERLKTQFESFASQMNSTFKNIGVSLFSQIGQSIGTALAGGNMKNVFKNFANVIGAGLQELGNKLIEIGILAKLSQKALASLFTHPELAIAVGIGLNAAGAALKLAFNKGITGFADGGLVAGSVFANIGEGRSTSRNNPEVISPLDKLKNFFVGMLHDFNGRAMSVGNYITGGQQNLQLQATPLRFDGRDLVGAIALINQSQGRGG